MSEYKHPGKWEDCHREDLRMIPKMRDAGWEVLFHSSDVINKRTTLEAIPNHGVNFRKGDTMLWTYIDRKKGVTVWRAVDLKGNHWCNHRDYESLQWILDHEKEVLPP